jgi:type I restriction-modification system DNA methylase subunit
MCKLANVNKNSKILDPTCGSGSFLVQALTQAIRTCDTDSDKEKVLKNNIFGFENEDKAFGLATTNMLIHKDGKSNICFGDCFEHKGTIGNSNINTILMNPPYNANYNKSNALKAILEDEYGYTEKKQQNNKKKEDPTKGLVFVNKICEWVGKGVCLCVLPLQAAIGNSTELAMAKKKLLDNNTLEAVYSMPNQLFYPGAAASVCVMQIRVGQRHNQDVPTFFGYFKDDGHMLKKNLGRVDTNNKWEDIEKKWLDAFVYKKIIPGLSVMKNVTHTDE